MNAANGRHAPSVDARRSTSILPPKSVSAVSTGMMLPVYARRFSTVAITFAPVDGTLADRIRADR